MKFRQGLRVNLFCPSRFSWSLLIKSLLCLIILSLLSVFLGVHSYLWAERSFVREFSLSSLHLDLHQLDEDHPEASLGPAQYLLPNDFLLGNAELCRRGDHFVVPRLLILVKSAIDNRQAREAIRQTWAQRERLEKNSVRLAFVIGLSADNRTLDKEHGDLIQIDQVDYYYHNTYKMVMMLRWIHEHCRWKSVESRHGDLRRYVLFIDDDYYLNLTSLLHFLDGVDQDSHLTRDDRRTFLTGYVYRQSRPRRFLNDRWYISVADYPFDRYPPYVTAGCFLMTRSNAGLFYIASQYLPLFRFDDIYLGLLAYAMSIPLIENNRLFSSYASPSSFSRWWNSSSESISPICLHGYRGEDLLRFWNKVQHLSSF